MRVRLLAVSLVLAVWTMPAAAVDTILYNGTIYTLQGGEPQPVSALAIDDGAVVATGDDAAILALATDTTRRVDLDGAFVSPGLTDAHAHLFNLGASLVRVDLRGAQSATECVQRAQALEGTLEPGVWLRGRGWDQNDWAGEEYPDRTALDAAFGERPVCLGRVDGHAIWVSTAALRLAGIDRNTKDPEGGEILRDVHGEATGILIDNAVDLIQVLLDAPGPAELAATLRRGIAEVHRYGITGLHEMGSTLDEVAALERAQAEGWLDLRLVCYLGGVQTLAAYKGGPVQGDCSAHLWIAGTKFYADGALGSRGAALLEDYSDRPGHRGLLIQSPEALQAAVLQSMERDLTPVIHAIGDRGVRVSLQAIIGAYAELDTDRPLPDWHARIEHAQIVHPDDFALFAANGIIPSMQPTHCTSDMPWAPERLGAKRLAGAYAWRTMLDLGLPLPLGSDFPVEETSPWLGLYAARTRHSTLTNQTWSPEQRLTALEALLGFTLWPAQVIGASGWGQLAVGSRADLIIVDRDPLAEDAASLLDTRVELTMVDGKVVYTDDDGRFSSR